MSSEDLGEWAKALVQARIPESSFLDYKAQISLDGRRNRIELAKDVSSFANEAGGALLYGVPEEQADGVPIPQDLGNCGIEASKNLAIDLENILLNTVQPVLPELFIAVLSLKDLSPKSLVMIYHPESWNKPHMVEAYEDVRYYRRGNFQVVPMKEREIEAAYSARRTSLDYARHFFDSGDFEVIPTDGQFLRVIVCPRFTLVRREQMAEEKFKDWLETNPPNGRRGRWAPFLDGWSFRGYPAGKFFGSQYELRLFHNGAMSFTMDIERAIYKTGPTPVLDLNRIEEVVNDMVIRYASKASEILRIFGPLCIEVGLHNVMELDATLSSDPNDRAGAPLKRSVIRFTEEASVSELQSDSNRVLKRLLDRLGSAFGIRQG